MKTEPAPAVSAELQPATSNAANLYRQATDVAHVCREIVLATVIEIGERRYVRVEGWQSIGQTYGYLTSIRSVEVLPGEGVRAVADLIRLSDRVVVSTAEGFVGVDEPEWYGGTVVRWNRKYKREETKVYPKRHEYAIRAMAQTRACARVLKQAFSHVVVLIDKQLSTVPAEEAAAIDLDEGEERTTTAPTVTPAAAAPTPTPAAAPAKPVEVPRDPSLQFRDEFRGRKWEAVPIHFGKKQGTKLGELEAASLRWWITEWHPKAYGDAAIPAVDLKLRAALDVAEEETANERK